MIKHTLIRNTAIVLLGITGMGLGSCKKEITQKVDQAFSAVYQVDPGAWNTDGPTHYYHDFNVPEIDQYLSDNGAVLVYISVNNNQDSWSALPEVFDGQAYSVLHQNGAVRVDLTPPVGSTQVVPPNTTRYFKVVLVDATPLD